jgi:hypothetical protein
MSDDTGKTIGDFRFGLDSPEAMARFTESLYREMEPVSEMGTVDPTLTYSEIADMIIDTICNYAGMGQIPATELPTLIKDALEQLAGGDDFESADEELL